jgi:tetratricopeptide (TPR) repeat protein
MNNKEKADEAYRRAKTLFFSRETPDLSGAIKEMQESLRLDDRGNGDRQYQLAKLCLMAYQEKGEGKDAAFAILAHQYFSAALEKGKHVKNMYLSPIKDLAMINYRAAIDVYHKKEDHTFLAQAAAYLKHSISLGGLPDGDAEYDLARLYYVWGRKEKALGYFLKAQSRGCSKLTSEDENFMATMDRSLGECKQKYYGC